MFTKTIGGCIASCSIVLFIFLVFNFACKEVVLLQVGHTFIVFCLLFVYTCLWKAYVNKVFFLVKFEEWVDEYNEALSWRRDPVGPAGAFPRQRALRGPFGAYPRGRLGIRYTIKSTIAKNFAWLLCLFVLFYSSQWQIFLHQLRLRGIFIRNFILFRTKTKCFLWISCSFLLHETIKSRIFKKVERKTEKVATLRHTYYSHFFKSHWFCVCEGDSNFELFDRNFIMTSPSLGLAIFSFSFLGSSWLFF